MKPRPVAILLFSVLLMTSGLGRLGHIYSIIAEVLLVSTSIALVLMLIVHPQVRLRTRALPKPDIRLNIDGSSH
jgi:hypothetical protein